MKSFKTKEWERYRLYEQAVQYTPFEIEFITNRYKKLLGRKPLSLREDFCGTAMLACDWAKQGEQYSSIGIDLDPVPLAYGEVIHRQSLPEEIQQRIHLYNKNVIECADLKADAIVAFNFSYWCFLERVTLLSYFQSVRQAMSNQSLFFLDISGGTEVMEPRTDKRRVGNFTYQWECKSYNPIDGRCHFAIHFKPRGKPLLKNAFQYEWRYWMLPEVKDILLEAGFSEVLTYWEGDDGEGGGNGIYRPAKRAEDSKIWVSYLIVLP